MISTMLGWRTMLSTSLEQRWFEGHDVTPEASCFYADFEQTVRHIADYNLIHYEP